MSNQRAVKAMLVTERLEQLPSPEKKVDFMKPCLLAL